MIYLRAIALLLAVMVMAGCATPHRSSVDGTLQMDRTQTVVDESEGDVDVDVDIGMPDDVFLIKPISGDSEAIPDIQLPKLSVPESGVYDAMRLIAKNAGLTLTVEGGPGASLKYGAVATLDIEGRLPDVLENLSRSIGFLYRLKGNVLTISPDRQYVVQLPPILNDDNLAGLTNTIQYLGARDTYLDRINRTLVFRGNRRVSDTVADYLAGIRRNRSMLVYDVHIYQVDLTDNKNTGISWSQLGYSTQVGAAGTAVVSAAPIGGASSATSGVDQVLRATAALATKTSAGVGLVLSGSRFGFSALVDYLKTQGTVESVQQPRVAMINGGKAAFRVGTTKIYISKVGTNFATSLNQTTTETQMLDTGIDIALQGDVTNGTVQTHIAMSIKDLVEMTPFEALGTQLTLPTTTVRTLDTFIRARSGDMMILSGIKITKQAKTTNSGVAQNINTAQLEKAELVVALKPRIVRFIESKPTAPTAASGITGEIVVRPAGVQSGNEIQGAFATTQGGVHEAH